MANVTIHCELLRIKEEDLPEMKISQNWRWQTRSKSVHENRMALISILCHFLWPVFYSVCWPCKLINLCVQFNKNNHKLLSVEDHMISLLENVSKEHHFSEIPTGMHSKLWPFGQVKIFIIWLKYIDVNQSGSERSGSLTRWSQWRRTGAFWYLNKKLTLLNIKVQIKNSLWKYQLQNSWIEWFQKLSTLKINC